MSIAVITAPTEPTNEFLLAYTSSPTQRRKYPPLAHTLSVYVISLILLSVENFLIVFEIMFE
jgi:hypothetical protein